jgi:predicted nucleic acid-binding protein
MERFVLDCSISLAWCFPDQTTPETHAVLERLEKKQKAVVPGQWYWETANVLGIAVRQKRITRAHCDNYLQTLSRLRIVSDDESFKRTLSDTLVLTMHMNVTAYDAAYLELAQRLDIPLATADKHMSRLARELKVALIEAA